ncbi:UNKNOWN [Stylonychia lemnae]|uniref:Uncharacterized protein n=1 Tax=Stylonychia lemnae TaxID=5949 RepID=A0A078B532_STYLE|nr:UNKNOWN [Stylonychia lemnae]|eukprot:CDW88648.1 UNKNOWN [Stylonychia lemnae]
MKFGSTMKNSQSRKVIQPKQLIKQRSISTQQIFDNKDEINKIEAFLTNRGVQVNNLPQFNYQSYLDNLRKGEELEKQKNFVKKVNSKVGFSLRDIALTKQKQVQEELQRQCLETEEMKAQKLKQKKEKNLKDKVKYFFRPYNLPVHHQHFMNFDEAQDESDDKIKKQNNLNRAWQQFYSLVLNHDKKEIEEMLSYIRHNQDKIQDNQNEQGIDDYSTDSDGKKKVKSQAVQNKIFKVQKRTSKDQSYASKSSKNLTHRSYADSQLDDASPTSRKRLIKNHVNAQLNNLENILNPPQVEDIFARPPPKSARGARNLYFSDLDYEQLKQQYKRQAEDSDGENTPTSSDSSSNNDKNKVNIILNKGDKEPIKPYFKRIVARKSEIQNMILEMKEQGMDVKQSQLKMSNFLQKVIDERNNRITSKSNYASQNFEALQCVHGGNLTKITEDPQLPATNQEEKRPGSRVVKRLKSITSISTLQRDEDSPQKPFNTQRQNNQEQKTVLFYRKNKIEPQVIDSINKGNKDLQIFSDMKQQSISSPNYLKRPQTCRDSNKKKMIFQIQEPIDFEQLLFGSDEKSSPQEETQKPKLTPRRPISSFPVKSYNKVHSKYQQKLKREISLSKLCDQIQTSSKDTNLTSQLSTRPNSSSKFSLVFKDKLIIV